MRILHILDEIWDSGLTHYAITLSAGLKARGQEVHVWALKGKPALEESERLGLNTLPIDKPWIRLVGLKNYLLSNKIDLVNAHTGSGHTLASFLVQMISLTRERKPFLVRTRGDSREIKAHLGSRWVFKWTQGFVAPNDSILRQFSRKYPSSEILARTIHQGIPDPWDSEPPSPPEGFLVGMVGRLDPVKGHEDFLRAAQKVADRTPSPVKFLIAGHEANLTTAQLEKTAASLGLAKYVQFLGRVPSVHEVMRRCAVGVIASKESEAVSRTAIEWMAAGRPLVSTTAGCLGELVEEGETGFLVPPSDPEKMAERILRVLAGRDTARSMGEKARKAFLSRFSLEKFAQETEKFYEEVIAKGERGNANWELRKAGAGGELKIDGEKE